MTKGAENPNKQKHEKSHNKLLCVTIFQEKKEAGEKSKEKATKNNRTKR